MVKIYDVSYEKFVVYMVSGTYRGGDMIKGMQLHWKTKEMIPMLACQNIAKMTVQSMNWQHQRNCIHRNLNGEKYLQDRQEIEKGTGPAAKDTETEFQVLVISARTEFTVPGRRKQGAPALAVPRGRDARTRRGQRLRDRRRRRTSSVGCMCSHSHRERKKRAERS